MKTHFIGFTLIILIAFGGCSNLSSSNPGLNFDRGENNELFAPSPGDPELIPDTVYLKDVILFDDPDKTNRFVLEVNGELPTPCNQLAIDINEPDQNNQIHVHIYSLINPAETCIAILEPFDHQIKIPVDDLPDGKYSIWVNEKILDEFSIE